MSAPEISPAAAQWREVVPQEPEHHLSHFEAFETFVAVDVEDESGTKIRAFDLPDVREIPVPRPAAIGVASTASKTTAKPIHEAKSTTRKYCGSASADRCSHNVSTTLT